MQQEEPKNGRYLIIGDADSTLIIASTKKLLSMMNFDRDDYILAGAD